MQRARTRNLVIRLSDKERAMLDVVSKREQMSASEVIRWLVRRECEREMTGEVKMKATKATKAKRAK